MDSSRNRDDPVVFRFLPIESSPGYDGRPYDRVAGFRVQGQPCVWCGGQACTGNNENLCFLPHHLRGDFFGEV